MKSSSLQRLVRPYPEQRVLLGDLLDFGGVLRRVVLFCKTTYGSLWPNHVVVELGSSIDRTDRLRLQCQAWLAIGLLCDEDHWAVVMCRRGHTDALLFDGLGRASIRAACEAFLEKVAKAWDQWLKTCVAPVPKQEDSWSCGHRTLAAVRHVLVQGKSHWPLNIPAEIFSHEQLASLCDEEKPEPKPKPQPTKLTPEPEPDLQPTAVADEADLEDMLVDLGPGLRKRAREEHKRKATEAKQPEQKRAKAPKLTPAALRKAMTKEGTDRALAAGITFNVKFQARHNANQDHMPAGHWLLW